MRRTAFLLSQFLSPLFNRRTDEYGGSLGSRMRLLMEVIGAVRAAVGPRFVVAVKLNASDRLTGGFEESEALDVISALDATGVDLIDISGGTYFPGATSASDGGGSGPYFTDFAARARPRTSIPLMVTGGFKTRRQAWTRSRPGTRTSSAWPAPSRSTPPSRDAGARPTPIPSIRCSRGSARRPKAGSPPGTRCG